MLNPRADRVGPDSEQELGQAKFEKSGKNRVTIK